MYIEIRTEVQQKVKTLIYNLQISSLEDEKDEQN